MLQGVEPLMLLVRCVDSSLHAIELAKENVLLNNLDPAKVSLVREDASEFMKDAASRQEFWDVIILDPPKLAPKRKACKFLDETWNPRITLIVAQKSHHTKFFKKGSPDNDLCMEYLWLEVFESFIQRELQSQLTITFSMTKLASKHMNWRNRYTLYPMCKPLLLSQVRVLIIFTTLKSRSGKAHCLMEIYETIAQQIKWQKEKRLPLYPSGELEVLLLSESVSEARRRALTNLNSKWQSLGKDTIQYFNLGDLWDCYDDWSASGVGSPIPLNKWGDCGSIIYTIPLFCSDVHR